jgi:hypothetical protein
MKVLFLDIDGVVNCERTTARYRGIIGIDPHMAFLVGRIILNTDAKIVLSSAWRGWPEGEEEIRKQVYDFIDCTKHIPDEDAVRGDEIKEWLGRHPEVQRYAILDDDTDMLPDQIDHLFQTEWETGITAEISDKVIAYLNA